MIQTLSETVILPIAGVILAIVMTLELIQIVTDRNNFHEIETAVFFKWMFKSACAILIVTNTWTIVMGIFDAAQSLVAQAAGVVVGDATVDISTMMDGLEERLMEIDLGSLFGLWFLSLFVGITAWAVAICIFIVIYGRMLEVYLTASPFTRCSSKTSRSMRTCQRPSGRAWATLCCCASRCLRLAAWRGVSLPRTNLRRRSFSKCHTYQSPKTSRK